MQIISELGIMSKITNHMKYEENGVCVDRLFRESNS